MAKCLLGPARKLCSPGLGQEGAHAAADGGPADGALLQVGGTLGTDQVAAGHEDNAHSAVQAHLAGPFLPQALKLLLCVSVSWGFKTFRYLWAWVPPGSSKTEGL